ncbi:MAG: DUF4402 domain-containing protein [Elusimicrobiota bacterium]|jgi:hypothetical protein|nr:DUF4402 domain-containing protein [Elusimicrobiota bacterium]
MKKLLILSLFLLTAGGYIFALQGQDDVVSTAYAVIVEPIEITEEQEMHFGYMVKPAVEEIVTLGNNGIASGASKHLGDEQQGIFKVSGEEDQEVTLTLPADGVVSLSGGPGPAMDVSSFTSDIGPRFSLLAGEATINVGARLKVAAGQLAGDYSGDYTVLVSY